METTKLYVEYIVVGMETLAVIFLVIFIIIGDAFLPIIKYCIKNSRIICSPRREKRIPETPQSRINTMFLRLCSFLWLRYKNLF